MAKRRDGAHAKYGSPFASLVWAFRKSDERTVHVREVESGFNEDLLCPAPDCRSPLIARKGPKGRVEHFAHHPGARVCGAWQETSAHYEAKAALAGALTLTLPAVVAEYGGVEREVSPEGHLNFDSVEVEYRMDGLTPDVVLRKVDAAGRVHELLVEIKVTHGCGPEKIARIRKGLYAAIEIDLGKWKHRTLEAIHEAVLRQAPRVWLYNARQEQEALALKAEAEARADHLATAMLSGLDAGKTRASHAEGPAAIAALRAIGEGRLSAVRVGDDAVFSVPTEEWQAALAHRYVLGDQIDDYYKPGFSLLTAATWMRRSGLVRAAFREPLEVATHRALLRARPSFRSPQALIKQYLQAVAKLGPLQLMDPDRWERRPSFGEAVKAAQGRERARAEQLARSRLRLEGLLATATEEERAGFDLARWERSPIPEFGRPLDRLCGEAAYDAFDEALDLLEAGVGWSGLWSGEDFLGLPLEGAVRRGVEAREAREAAVAAEKAEAERQRLLQLVDRIAVRAAYLMGGCEAAEWMAPRRAGLEADPAERDRAWRDLAEVERRLKAQAALDALVAEVRAELEKAAEARLGDLAGWFLRTGNNLCDGRHPWDYTVDRHTLRDALRAVEMAPKPGRRRR